MCRAVMCRTCSKVTWTGCGQHVAEAMAAFPAEDRCAGHEKEPGQGFWTKLLGR